MVKPALLPLGAWLLLFLRKIKPYRIKYTQLRQEGRFEEERECMREAVQVWSQAVLEHMHITLHVEREGEIPEGPVVFIANHQGYLDIPTIGAAIPEKQKGFIAKTDLAKIPFYGGWIGSIRSVFIMRDEPREALKAINEGIGLLEQGFSLVLFPEGTRSKGTEPGEFKKASFRLATKPEVPIVPVTISGTYLGYEENGPRPAHVYVHVHPAIPTAGLGKGEKNALADQVEEIVVTKLRELQALAKKEGTQ